MLDRITDQWPDYFAAGGMDKESVVVLLSNFSEIHYIAKGHKGRRL